MLRQPEGATVDEVASVTGWQRHTVRGVFSGTLKKKLGLILASAKEEQGVARRSLSAWRGKPAGPPRMAIRLSRSTGPHLRSHQLE
jgi:hypothetical protein